MFRCLKMLPVFALACTLGLIWMPDARAQSAKDLDCKRCVDKRDIARNAVVRSRIKDNAINGRKIKNGAVSESKLGFDVATQEELDALALDQGAILTYLLPKTIFVTSGAFTGNLGGLAGADAICQAAADDPQAVVPAGNYVAWLSTDTVDARDRITQTLGPYVRADGRVVAKSYAELINTDNTVFLSPIELDEFGNTGSVFVFTGTSLTGTGGLDISCSGWTSSDAAESALAGSSEFPHPGWTGQGFTNCNNSRHFYCFQR